MEGPDGAGKTTLLDKLSRALETDIMPRAADSIKGPVKNLKEWVETDLGNLKRKDHKGIQLYDRHPLISDPIYGPLIRGSMSEGFGSPWFIDAWKVFVDLNPVIIFCLPGVDEVAANIQKDDTPQMDGVAFNIRAIYWLYFNLMTRLRATGDCQTIVWDYTDPEAPVHYQKILSYMRQEKRNRG